MRPYYVSLIISFVLYFSYKFVHSSFEIHSVLVTGTVATCCVYLKKLIAIAERLVSGQLAPGTVRPGRLSPESTNYYNVLAVCFLPGFSTNDSILYVLVVNFLQTFLRCVEIKVFNFEVKAKERLVGSVEMQSEICQRRWSMLLEQNNHM